MKTERLLYGGYDSSSAVTIGDRTFAVLHTRRDPVTADEISNKSYVDNKYSLISGDSFTQGTLHRNRTPAFSGDVFKSMGGDTLQLNTGSAVGTDSMHCAANVDARGLLMSTSAITPADIPNFHWSKVSVNKPTTLSGWGVTDALPVTGGTVNGPVHLNVSGGADFSNPLTAINKQKLTEQATAMVNTYATYRTGALRKKYGSASMPGFLRCNGASVSKTDYAALYSVLGDVYSSPLRPGMGRPWMLQNKINTASNGAITGWKTGNPLPEGMSYHKAIVTKNRVYVMGRYSIGVFTAEIQSDGALGAWSSAPSLPSPMGNSEVVVTKNRVYLMEYLGVPTILTAPINSDGTLGTWTTSPSTPYGAACACSFVSSTRVYILGGYLDGNTTHNIIQYAPVNEDGTIGTWVVSPTPLPFNLGYSHIAPVGNYIYLIGGRQDTAYSADIHRATVDSNGVLGTFTKVGALPFNCIQGHVVVTAKSVYLIGGIQNNAASAKIYKSDINADNTLGTWLESSQLPATLLIGQCVIIKDKIYMLGGMRSNTMITDVIYADFKGGKSDYSDYYNGLVDVSSPDKFTLPDLTSQENLGLYTYIKT